jgi:hypothetical protein
MIRQSGSHFAEKIMRANKAGGSPDTSRDLLGGNQSCATLLVVRRSIVPGLARTMAVAMGLIGGVVASQGPEFAQQYRQRLGGTIDELQRVIQRFDTDAVANGQNRANAIDRLRGNADTLVSRQGEAMRANVERLERLQRHRQDFMEAGPFDRLLILLRDADVDLAEATYHDFEPAVPATQEGVVAAAAGLVVGWGLTLLSVGFVRRLVRLGRRDTWRPSSPRVRGEA